MATTGRTAARGSLVAAALLAALLAAAPAHAERADRRQQLLERMVSVVGGPGGVMLVDDGSRIWRGSSGLANRRTGEPMRVRRAFRIASITKTFVATVVLQLAAEGRLGLDDPVARWVPEIGAGTIRQLLNHTSGVNDSGQGPTGAFFYSNRNYQILGRVIEAVTGAKLPAELKRRIMDPLRLDHTLWPTRATVPGLAHGYIGPPSGKHDLDVTRQSVTALGAAGALVSTADDLRRFLRALFGGSLVPPALVQAMQTPVAIPPEHRNIFDGYGLGLVELQTPCGTLWGHRGRLSGYSSFAFASPDGRRAVIVLLNHGGVITGISDDQVVRLHRLMFAAYCLGTPAPRPGPSVTSRSSRAVTSTVR
jgi:D-alanyl-D-alanine carboxypeptidase